MNFYQYITGGSSREPEIAEENEIQSAFLSKLKHEANLAGGGFLYNCDGALQDYLKKVEDNVLLYIILAKFDVAHAATLFQDRAQRLTCGEIGLQFSSFVYTISPIDQIRGSIRIFFVKSSGSMFRVIDDILHSLAKEEQPPPLVRKLMMEKGRLLRPQLKDPLPFVSLPLIDDSMNSVMEMSILQLQRSANGCDDNRIAIRVTKCGSAQVNGDYTLTSGTAVYVCVEGEGDICFTNSSGFQLTRTERYLTKNMNEAESTDGVNDVIFDWHFVNPVLSCSYYLCSTFSRATLPPLR